MTAHRLHRPTRENADGFTLLELITVLGVIAVLSGFGIGFLSRSENDMDIALSVVRDKIRLAHETARTTGRQTFVELVNRYEDKQVIGQFLRAKVLAVIGQWHLEPGERGFAGLTPELRGEYDQNGRYGHGMRPNGEKGGTLFSIHTRDDARFQMRGGFAFKVELFLESRERCVVTSLEQTFTLELDRDLSPTASMFLAEGPRRGPQVRIDTSNAELPLRRWVSVELVHDGREFRLLVDGEEVGKKSAAGEAYQVRQGSLFEVSPGESPIPGMVDEIQLLAYHRDDPAEIPTGIELKGFEKPVVYDRRGKLIAPVQLEFKLADQTRRFVVAPGGVLQ
jgi:prepilin-type N-terminal cleavage/methylation domain-containing protein